MPLLVAALLGLAALALVVYPLMDTGSVRHAGGTAATHTALDAEAIAKQALRDVDFDRRLGNLEESDYQALRERYEERALAAMKARYDQERAADALIDARLAALRAPGAQRADERDEKAAKTAKTANVSRAEPLKKAMQAAGGDESPSATKPGRRASVDKPGLRRRREV